MGPILAVFAVLLLIMVGCQALSDPSNDPSNDPSQCYYDDPIPHYDDC